MRLVNRHIYVVGDDAQHNAAVSLLLGQHSATLRVECWASDAISSVNPLSPADIILLDPMPSCKTMTANSFFTLFSHIRTVPALTGVPVVAVSLADPGTLIPFLREIGFRGFLRKPLNHATFANQVAEIVGGKQVWEYR